MPIDQGHFPVLLRYQLAHCHGLHNVQEPTGVVCPKFHDTYLVFKHIDLSTLSSLHMQKIFIGYC